MAAAPEASTSSSVSFVCFVGQNIASAKRPTIRSAYIGAGDFGKMVQTMTVVKRLALAALAALTIAGSGAATISAADARPGFRGHHGGYHGGFRGRGFRFGPGIAAGFALGGLGYYAYNGYGGCYVERRLVVDRWGRQFVRPVRVCV